MHTIEIPDLGKTLSLPSCWEECTPDQIDHILPLAFLVTADKLDTHEFCVRVFAYLTGLQTGSSSSFFGKLNPNRNDEVYARVSQLAEDLCSWPFQEVASATNDETRLELSLATHVNLLPSISVGHAKLHGPADLVADLSFAEFRHAVREMDAHINFSKDPDAHLEAEEALNRFVATLYRPLDPATGKKGKFAPDQLLDLLPIASEIPQWKKWTVLLWFSYCINYIQGGDITVDGNTINLSVLFPKSGGQHDGEKNGIGWAGLLFDVSKEGPFGDVDKTDQVGLFDILLYLYKNHQDNKKLQKRMKSKK